MTNDKMAKSLDRKLTCVVHYPRLITSSILPLNDHKPSVLLSNKEAREKLGGEYAHIEQCEGIPFDLTVHGTHTECYKKFTLAKSIKKRKGIANDDDDDRPGQSSS